MRLSVVLAILVTLLMGCAHAATHWMAPRVVPVAVRGDAPFRQAMLDGQNAARVAVGVAPLVWDAGLAADAAAYAAVLAKTGVFRHAVQPMDAHREGENLWMGSRGAYAYADMVGMWVAEGRNFVNAPTPNFSRTGRWQDVGHYSQIVWRRTAAVGCGIASDAANDYVVCRYRAPGNVVGQAAF